MAIDLRSHWLSMGLLAWLLVGPAFAQGHQPRASSAPVRRNSLDATIFKVDRTLTPARASADRVGISASRALHALAQAMDWRYRPATDSVEGALDRVSLDLAFVDQPARGVAHLLAISAGVDVVFDDPPAGSDGAVELHIVHAPSAETDSGVTRLRSWATRWYQTYLAAEVAWNPSAEESVADVRMHLGDLLMEHGDLQAAVDVFLDLRNKNPQHRYVPQAALRLAEAYFELGRFVDAANWAHQVSLTHPSYKVTAKGAVLYGKILLEQGKSDPLKYEECVRVMRSRMLPLSDTPEILDILLVLAEAHRHRARPDYVLDHMRQLAEVTDVRELTKQQWLDYHFLRGFGAEGTQEYDEAMQAFEIFLGTPSADPRRGLGFVLLGRCYLALERFVEAHAAAAKAVAHAPQLSTEARKKARILKAKTALALGVGEKAFEELELEVRRDPGKMPELVLFLVDAYVDAGEFQRAVYAASLLQDRKDKWGDAARLAKLRAMHREAERSGKLRDFVTEAVRIAPSIQDESASAKAARLIGQAYEVLGEHEKALQAYSGVLQR